MKLSHGINRRWVIRLAVSAALLTVVFWFLPLGKVWQAARSISLSVWLSTLAVFLLAHGLAAIKWWLLADRGIDTLSRFLRGHFAGLFGNLCLPGVAGGDLVRCLYVMRRDEHSEQLAVISLADRLVDTLALLLLATGAALWLAEPHALASRLLAYLAVAAVIGGAGAIFGYWLLGRLSGRHQRLAKVHEAVQTLVRRPFLVARSLVLSLIIQSVFVFLSMRLGHAVGVGLEMDSWLLAWPLAKLAAMMPLTLGGLGVRESALALMMQPLGADGALVTAASLLWQSIVYAGGLVGGAFVFRQGVVWKTDEKSAA